MGQFNKHLVIIGTARSGTSWLSETLAQQHRYRMLFEPEHETRTQKGYLLCDQWLEYSHYNHEAKNYLKRVFKNRIDCDWIAQNSNRSLKRHLWPFIPKQYIIKFVRGNLLSSIILKEFQVPLIHLIRSPYDVLNSQKRSSFPWLQDLSIFSSQPELVTLLQENYGLDLKNLKDYTDMQLRAIRWCIENVLPLEFWDTGTNRLYEVVRYEDLFKDIEYFYKLCERFGIEPVSNVSSLYRKPSSKTHKNSAIKNDASKYLLGTDEIVGISEILNIFKTSLYPIL